MSPPPEGGHGPESRVWTGVPAEEIVDGFLADYVSDPKAQRVRPAFIAEYIRRCQRVGELENWTVRLVSSTSGEPRKIGPYEVGLIKRKQDQRRSSAGAALHDPPRRQPHRRVQPTSMRTSVTRAMAATRKAAEGKLDKNGQPRDPKVPTGPPLRRQRRPDQALLLLYPLKNPLQADGQMPATGRGIRDQLPVLRASRPQTEYVVNEIWQQQALEDPDDEDTDDMSITERDWDQLEADQHAQRHHRPPCSTPVRRTTSSSPSNTPTATACSPSDSATRQRTARCAACMPSRAPADWRCSSPGWTTTAASYASFSPQTTCVRCSTRWPTTSPRPPRRRPGLSKPCSLPPPDSSTGGTCCRTSPRQA